MNFNIKNFIQLVLLYILQSLVYGQLIGNFDTNKKVIVIVDSSTYQITHSQFFDDLRSKGYNLEFGSLNSINLKLQQYDEYIYDHMIIMATAEFTGKGLNINKILDFYDAGKNIFLAGNIDSSKSLRQLFNEFGVKFDEIGSQVWDDYNYPEFTYEHNIIYTYNYEGDVRSFGGKCEFPILYRGTALKVDPEAKNKEYVWGILKGENTTYSYNQEKKKVSIQGRNNILLAATQGRNNARVIMTGSIEMFSNDFYNQKEYSNREYMNNILLWNFKENGLLKAENIHHHKEGEVDIPYSYKIEDQVYYYIDIYRWNHTISDWVPYIINDHQIMLEFTMLDPYYRIPLEKKIGSPQYSASFKAPDTYGVYQFKINYKRPGYTFLNISTKVPVRPPKHNEYESYVQQAYPYYLSTLLTIVGFFIYIIFLLYDKDYLKTFSQKQKKIQKDQQQQQQQQQEKEDQQKKSAKEKKNQ